MQPVELIVALTLTIIGLLIILALIKVMFGGLFGGWAQWFDRYKIRQKETLLERSDVYLKAGDFESVVTFLRGSFLLDHVKSELKLVERMHNHHMAALGRILMLAERYTIHLETLPVVEDLLVTRSQLLRSFIEKSRARKTLRSGSGERPRTAPRWAVNEFDSQLADIREKLATNRKSLDSQIEKLFSNLGNLRRVDEVTYH